VGIELRYGLGDRSHDLPPSIDLSKQVGHPQFRA